MPSGHITNLPLELLSEITRNVVYNSKKDLCQLRRVSSLFETLATREIFKSITIRNDKGSADRFWNLLHSSRIASHIQSISFVEEYVFNSREKGVRELLEAAFSILLQAPGLKNLEFHFCPYFKDDYKYIAKYVEAFTNQLCIVFALGRNRTPLPAPQSLKIDGWICCKDEFMLAFDIPWLASLRHLSFTVPRMTSNYKLESLKRFWKQVVVRRVLQPAVNLESLEIIGSSGELEPAHLVAQCFDVPQAQLATFPQLATLSLKRIIWEDDTSGQGNMIPLEFILRHQKTLKRLELHYCTIDVGKRDGPPPCYWADVFKRMANTLTGLVELKVKFKLKDRLPYVCFGGNTSYEYLTKEDLKGMEKDADAALAQDALALEEFRAVVKCQGMGVALGFDRDAKPKPID